MGWGCYKHEWDAGSENWRSYMEDLCDRKLHDSDRTWGRDLQICPLCYVELETEVVTLRQKLKDVQQALTRIPETPS